MYFTAWITICLHIEPVHASPRLITDNRVENLNGFPSIGRGYNLQSNTLQSMCFSKVTKTTPTFDLNYEMDEVSQEFFNEVPEVGKKRMGNINVHFFVKKYFKSQEIGTQQTHTLKNLLVRVEIRSYYYALDETQSVLSESAKQLLKNKEFVTFFNSCGQHYVRSVGSFSTYLALLQYRLTGNNTSDQAFVSRLEKGLFNFSGDGKPQEQFNQDAEARGMRVYVQAVGLSKGNLVNLIPVDVKQFRLTVQDTVKLMQDPNAGLVSYIEVVPWVENPELSSFMSGGMSEGGEQFIKLQRLEANSGVITEINRISNSQVEQFYIASMCEKILFENYMDKTNRQFYENITGQTKKSPTVLMLTDIIDQKVLSYNMEKTLFYNLANISKDEVFISLREFVEYFAKNPPRKLFDENRTYLYGDGNTLGAINCIDELYKQGLDKIDYRTIPSCVSALKHIQTQSFFLNQYCLPKPAKLIFKGDEIKSQLPDEVTSPRLIDAEIPGLEEGTPGIKGEKPESLSDLAGEKVEEPAKQKDETQTEEQLQSLDNLFNQDDSQPIDFDLDEEDDQPTSLILQELEEGEKEAKSKTTPQEESPKESQDILSIPKTETQIPPVEAIPEVEEEILPKVEEEILPEVEDQTIPLIEDDILKRNYGEPLTLDSESNIGIESNDVLHVEE